MMGCHEMTQRLPKQHTAAGNLFPLQQKKSYQHTLIKKIHTFLCDHLNIINYLFNFGGIFSLHE